MFNRSLTLAAALGIALTGATFATNASASPRHGGHGGGWHHGHGHHGGGWNHGGWNIRVGGGGYGLGGYDDDYGYRPGCRLVERENRWGEIVIRRICARPRY